jgi:hypothetical protein
MVNVKCQYCNIKDDKKVMTKSIHPKGYIHLACISDFEIDQKKKNEENQQWKNLFEYLKEIHNALTIPPRNIKRLREIKEEKNITYDLILEAYKKCEHSMKWFIENVLKGNCDAEGINACITFMLNKGLNSAWQDRENKRKQQEQIQKQIEKKIDEDKDLKTNNTYKNNNKDEMDITAFL